MTHARKQAGLQPFPAWPRPCTRGGQHGGGKWLSIPRTRLAGAFPRYDCSIPVRFRAASRDGQGTILSIGAGGAFVRTAELPPIDQRVTVAFRLAPGADPVHVRARVRYHHARQGVERIPGFGLTFEMAPDDLGHRLERMMTDYAGPVAHEASGDVTWPLGFAAEIGSRGLQLAPVPIPTAA